MIEAVFYTNTAGRIWSFQIHGHAGYANAGEPDIVCAAVSALSLNTVNGLEKFSEDAFSYEMDPDGFLSAAVEAVRAGKGSSQTDLILNLLLLGLQSVSESYSEHVTVKVCKRT